jgi:hypothetical protein
VGDYIVSIGDVAVTNDDSFGTFRTRYAGAAVATLPLVVRRAGQTVTLQLPLRLSVRVQTTVTPIPNATEKAVRIRAGIMSGSTL